MKSWVELELVIDTENERETKQTRASIARKAGHLSLAVRLGNHPKNYSGPVKAVTETYPSLANEPSKWSNQRSCPSKLV